MVDHLLREMPAEVCKKYIDTISTSLLGKDFLTFEYTSSELEKEKLPNAFDRALKILDRSGIERFVCAAYQTRGMEEDEHSSFVWDAHVGISDRISRAGLDLAESHPLETELFVDWILENHRIFGKGGYFPKVPCGYAIRILAEGFKKTPKEITEKIWEQGIKNKYYLSMSKMCEEKREGESISRFATICNCESYNKEKNSPLEDFLKEKYPLVLKDFYTSIPKNLPARTFRAAFFEDMLLNKRGANAFLECVLYSQALRRFCEHKQPVLLYEDFQKVWIEKKYRLPTPPSSEVQEKLRKLIQQRTENPYRPPEIWGLWNNLSTSCNINGYIETLDDRLSVIEVIKRGFPYSYSFRGYGKTENELSIIKEQLTNFRETIKVQMENVAADACKSIEDISKEIDPYLNKLNILPLILDQRFYSPE